MAAAADLFVRDGDGWVRCGGGHDHWGVHGAAGLLLTAPDRSVLLQHRAAWSHHGDTWGLPGGAKSRAESAIEAAVREAQEETGLDPDGIEVANTWVDDHGGWAYTTVLAVAGSRLDVHARDRESIAVRWVSMEDVTALRLHPGFAAAWPVLLDQIRGS